MFVSLNENNRTRKTAAPDPKEKHTLIEGTVPRKLKETCAGKFWHSLIIGLHHCVSPEPTEMSVVRLYRLNCWTCILDFDDQESWMKYLAYQILRWERCMGQGPQFSLTTPRLPSDVCYGIEWGHTREVSCTCRTYSGNTGYADEIQNLCREKASHGQFGNIFTA